MTGGEPVRSDGVMADVLVLGGTAWLGREIARTALERGHPVTCLARGEAGPVAPGASFVRADRRAPGAYDEVAGRDWDLVVDVSWQPGMVRDAVGALAGRARRWVYVSSCSVYADVGTPGDDETAALAEPLDSDVADGYDDYSAAKARCERIVTDALGDRALLARAGLIAGPGDASDRFGYWVSRFALAGDGPVLVPDAPDSPTETLDVRDLAAFLVDVGLGSGTDDAAPGPVNVVGEHRTLGTVLSRAADVAEFTGPMVPAAPAWLTEQEVAPWSGPRSLPLWLPMPEYAGFPTRDDSRARRLGLTRRPLDDTLRDTLADERDRGLDRDRKAGLTRTDELALLDAQETVSA